MVAQLGQMRIAGVRRDAEIGERIGLAADILRHFLKPDPVVTQQRFALHLCLQLVPGCEEAFRRYAPGKVAGEEWRVIVAELLAEPAEPSRQSSRRDAKRQQQSDFAVAELADGNDGRTCSRSPTCRCHVASQSKVWNTVQSATRSKPRHSASTEVRSL